MLEFVYGSDCEFIESVGALRLRRLEPEEYGGNSSCVRDNLVDVVEAAGDHVPVTY